MLQTLDHGTQVVLGASKKDNDWKRWLGAAAWIKKEKLPINLINPEWTAVNASVNREGLVYSASNIRNNFDNPELIANDIPTHVDANEITRILGSL